MRYARLRELKRYNHLGANASVRFRIKSSHGEQHEPLIQIVHGSIVDINCNALVNCTNAAMYGSRNVSYWMFAGRKNTDTVIHQQAGPSLQRACDALPVVDRVGNIAVKCRIGSAVITNAFNLSSSDPLDKVCDEANSSSGQCDGIRRIIHTVAPRYVSSLHADATSDAAQTFRQQLQSCYQSCLLAAEQDGDRCKSIAFPAIGCGVNDIPLYESADACCHVILDHFAPEAHMVNGGKGHEMDDESVQKDITISDEGSRNPNKSEICNVVLCMYEAKAFAIWVKYFRQRSDFIEL
jgi:O-acetyl-ADP-ribose deacetylase (regulator of RNase III)